MQFVPHNPLFAKTANYNNEVWDVLANLHEMMGDVTTRRDGRFYLTGVMEIHPSNPTP